MLNAAHQGAILDFVRVEVIGARTGEVIEILAAPELLNRSVPAVEQLWTSRSRSYAVEHTRIETFDGQIENEALVRRFLLPVRSALQGLLPGTFEHGVSAAELKAARVRFAVAQAEICRLVLEAAPTMAVRERRRLTSDTVPFALQLSRRHADSSRVLLAAHIVGDAASLRGEANAIPRALDAYGKFACLGLFAAAEALGYGFVQGAPAHVLVQHIDADRLRRMRLGPSEPGQKADLVLRVPSAPESVFRGMVVLNKLKVSDLLQVWLDVAHHPARGKQQADHLWKRIIQPMVQQVQSDAS